MKRVQEWIDQSGINKRQIAMRSGLARTTIDRLIAGSQVARLDTLRELAITCGLDLSIDAVPLADPFAAEAARYLLEPGYVPSDAGLTEAWVERFERWFGPDYSEVAEAAARAANPRGQVGTRFLKVAAPKRVTAFVAEALAEHLDDWALSGTLLYVGGPCKAQELLELAGAAPIDQDRADLILVPAVPQFFFGARKEGGVRLVSIVQEQVDAYA